MDDHTKDVSMSPVTDMVVYGTAALDQGGNPHIAF
jgi:hypothetical protein